MLFRRDPLLPVLPDLLAQPELWVTANSDHLHASLDKCAQLMSLDGLGKMITCVTVCDRQAEGRPPTLTSE
jgi:hypothetical protein